MQEFFELNFLNIQGHQIAVFFVVMLFKFKPVRDWFSDESDNIQRIALAGAYGVAVLAALYASCFDFPLDLGQVCQQGVPVGQQALGILSQIAIFAVSGKVQYETIEWLKALKSSE